MKNLLKNSLVILFIFFSITILTISCEMESVAQNPTTYTLPIATSARLGGVIVGSGLSITPDGLLSSTIDPAKFTIPLATNAVVGGVKVGSGLAIATDGTLSTKSLDVLVFSKVDDKYNEFWTANIDGTNQKKISIALPEKAFFSKETIKISPDGKKFFFIANPDESTAQDALYSCNVDGTGLTKLIDKAVKFSDIK
jgi:hypothetical protein